MYLEEENRQQISTAEKFSVDKRRNATASLQIALILPLFKSVFYMTFN